MSTIDRPSEAKVIQCPECGRGNGDWAHLCGYCGASLIQKSVTTPAASVRPLPSNEKVVPRWTDRSDKEWPLEVVPAWGYDAAVTEIRAAHKALRFAQAGRDDPTPCQCRYCGGNERPPSETLNVAPFPYPTDRDGWICSVCHGWNVPKDRVCMHSHLPPKLKADNLYGGKVRLACGCIDICTNQRDHEPHTQKACEHCGERHAVGPCKDAVVP